MATYTVTTANWNDPAFWSGISTVNGDTLDLSGLGPSFGFEFDAFSGTLTLTDGVQVFTVGDAGATGTDTTLAAGFINDFDTLSGTGGDDDVVHGGDNQSIDGGDGDDTINVSGGDDSVEGGAGNDTILGGDGDDQLYGGTGDDTIDTGMGADTAFGGAGNDVLTDGSTGATPTTLYGGDGDDTLFTGTGNARSFYYGGAGNDLIVDRGVASGNQTLDGGAGDDTIQGAGGADQILGGTGNDVLSGGAGNDTLTGGAGDDTFVLGQSSGSDIITDFDTADTDGDGRFNDQIDVGDLQTASGAPVTGFDVVVTDDGSGNALLTFPMGETLILQGVSPAQMSNAGQLFKAGIPCFASGTMILTPGGEVPVEHLAAGDAVVTRDHGVQPLFWAGRKDLLARDLIEAPERRPIWLAPGAMGMPRGLLVSPQHCILVAHPAWGAQPRFVRARHLARLKGGKVRVARGVRKITYHHLLFARHQVVFANGTATESFYPGPWALRGLSPGAMLDVLALLPGLGRADAGTVYGATAWPVCAFGALPPRLADLAAVRGARVNPAPSRARVSPLRPPSDTAPPWRSRCPGTSRTRPDSRSVAAG